MNGQMFLSDPPLISLAPCTETACPQEPCKKKGKNPMRYYDEIQDCYVETTAAPSDDTRKSMYLQSRLNDLNYAKLDELQKSFGLKDDERPGTVTELLARIAAGKYTVPTDKADRKDYDPVRYIRWRDPAVKEDQAGFDAAWKLFEKAVIATKDTIIVGTPADGLTALQALETWTAPTA